MEGDTADDLHVIVLHMQDPARRFAHESERIVKDVVERFALGEPAFEHVRLRAQLRVRHRGILRFELFDFRRHPIESFQTLAAFAVKNIIDQSHKPLLCARLPRAAVC